MTLPVAITGAGGRLGRVLCDRLGSRYRLTAVCRRPLADNACICADIREAATLRGVFAGHDAVVHLAALTSASDPLDALWQSNVIGTLNVLNAAVQSGVRRFVFASSLSVYSGYVPELFAFCQDRPPLDLAGKHGFFDQLPYPKPVEPYGLTKLCGEGLCALYAQTHGLCCTILRIGEVRAEPPALPVTPLDAVRFCSVDAFVAAVEQALQRDPEPGVTLLRVLSENDDCHRRTSHDA